MLLVPAGSLNTYRNHPEWGKIEDIYEFNDELPLLSFTSYDPLAGEELTIAHGNETFTIRVSPDEKFVTVIGYSATSIGHNVNFANPLTDPATGKTYTINVIGTLDDFRYQLDITDNIIRINDNALTLNGLLNVSIPRSNSLIYLGSDNFNSSAYTVEELHLGDGAVMKSGNNFPYKVVLDNVSSIGESQKNVFGIYNNPTPTWKQTIECTSPVPPVVYGTLYHSLQDTLYATTTLIVPKECKEIYSKAYEWCRLSNIIESTTSDITDIAATENDLLIRPTSGGIMITSHCNTQINVITIDGHTLLSRQVPAGQTFIELPSGFFIVTDPSGYSSKVLVR